jgi:hypothetical protein
LVINPNVLATGSLYRFRLEAQSSRGLGWAEIDVTPEERPNGGCCTASATSGEAYMDIFSITCTNFEVGGVVEPVRYRWYRVDNGEEIPLISGLSFKNQIDFVLPVGNNVVISEIVSPSGATYRISTTIVTTEPSIFATASPADIAGELLSGVRVPTTFDTASAAGDLDQMMQMLDLIVNVLKPDLSKSLSAAKLIFYRLKK